MTFDFKTGHASLLHSYLQNNSLTTTKLTTNGINISTDISSFILCNQQINNNFDNELKFSLCVRFVLFMCTFCFIYRNMQCCFKNIYAWFVFIAISGKQCVFEFYLWLSCANTKKLSDPKTQNFKIVDHLSGYTSVVKSYKHLFYSKYGLHLKILMENPILLELLLLINGCNNKKLFFTQNNKIIDSLNYDLIIITRIILQIPPPFCMYTKKALNNVELPKIKNIPQISLLNEQTNLIKLSPIIKPKYTPSNSVRIIVPICSGMNGNKAINFVYTPSKS